MLTIESITLESVPLDRSVKLDIYYSSEETAAADCELILFNDGQDLATMRFAEIVNMVQGVSPLKPFICIGIHCGDDRMNEYGMTAAPDYQGRGAKAALYERFILDELLPYAHSKFNSPRFNGYCFAGFSLGGLNAIDTAWNHPELFSRTAAFSGSFWWRSKAKDAPDYSEKTDRLMHQQIRKSAPRPGLKFFFQCGTLDETEDRNKNGVIDSIDDTIDLMKELLRKGYLEGADFRYLQLRDGRHDVPTWARAMPEFLRWGWGTR
jgi:enterochelin esterase-like enzyme